MHVNLERPVTVFGFLGNVCMCWCFFSSRSEFFCVLGVNHNAFFPLHFFKLRIKGSKPFYTSGWKADQALGDE